MPKDAWRSANLRADYGPARPSAYARLSHGRKKTPAGVKSKRRRKGRRHSLNSDRSNGQSGRQRTSRSSRQPLESWACDRLVEELNAANYDVQFEVELHVIEEEKIAVFLYRRGRCIGSWAFLKGVAKSPRHLAPEVLDAVMECAWQHRRS